MDATTYGGNGFKERTRVSGERPTSAASFRQQSIKASCQPHPPCPLGGTSVERTLSNGWNTP